MGSHGQPERVRVIHWKAEESGPLTDACRAGGFEVEYAAARFPDIARAVRANPPDAIVIDLSRLPSHGKETAIQFRNAKYSRAIPLVFVGGVEEKVEAIRALLPDAEFTGLGGVSAALKRVLRAPVKEPVAPPPMMERYGGRSIAQKLGIKEGTTVAVFNAPRDYASVVGDLPEGAQFAEEPRAAHPLTLWFAEDLPAYLGALPGMRKLALRTKLWIVWRKGLKGEHRLTDKLVREYAIEAGLVDYKICSLGEVWSGMLFAARRP